MSDNLWGDLPTALDVVHPKSVLAEQAAVLSQQTKGILHAGVELLTESDRRFRGDCCLKFTIICPSLQNYCYEVLRAYYNATEVYPIDVADMTSPTPGKDKKSADDVESFKEAVGNILQSPRVRKAVAALLRDAND